MNDVINREDAISAILSTGHIAKLSDGDAAIRVSAVNYVLRNLPSAQPEPEWIPVGERLPKENGFYLTSTMYGEVYLDAWNGINWERSEEILAWMPLPEAYREEGDS